MSVQHETASFIHTLTHSYEVAYALAYAHGAYCACFPYLCTLHLMLIACTLVYARTFLCFRTLFVHMRMQVRMQVRINMRTYENNCCAYSSVSTFAHDHARVCVLYNAQYAQLCTYAHVYKHTFLLTK